MRLLATLYGCLLAVACGTRHGDDGRGDSDSDTDSTSMSATDSDSDVDSDADTDSGTGSDTAVDCGALPDMVAIPAGPFMMGCNEAIDGDCAADEYPYHEVTLRAFEIDRTEVTQSAYAACVDAGMCPEPPASWDAAPHWDPVKWAQIPLDIVRWSEAVQYCEWRGKRLPSEAEWEKAARGTEGALYPWGNDEPDCEPYRAQACCNPGIGFEDVCYAPAGASPYGAMDMMGNVLEWVSDWYDPTYYAASPPEDPAGPAAGTDRVLKGGQYNHCAPVSRRYFAEPEQQEVGRGFRCAR